MATASSLSCVPMLFLHEIEMLNNFVAFLLIVSRVSSAKAIWGIWNYWISSSIGRQA